MYPLWKFFEILLVKCYLQLNALLALNMCEFLNLFEIFESLLSLKKNLCFQNTSFYIQQDGSVGRGTCTKPDDMSSIPWTHKIKGRNLLASIWMAWHIHPHTYILAYTHIFNKWINLISIVDYIFIHQFIHQIFLGYLSYVAHIFTELGIYSK